MKNKRMMKRFAAVLLATVLTIPTIANVEAADRDENGESLFYMENSDSYEDYLQQCPDGKDATASSRILCSEQENGAEKRQIEETACDYLPQDAVAEYTFSIEETAFYNMELLYYSVDDADTSIKLNIKIDGQNWFENMTNVTLSRVWGFSEEISLDTQGNDIRPDSVEKPQWIRYRLEDTTGAGGTGLKFYLSQGTHTIQMEVLQNPIAISEITFVPPKAVESYDEVMKRWEQAGCQDASESLELIQAEQTQKRSDKSIAMLNDRSSSATTPYHAYKVRYNSIGGSTWKTVGEWIEWDVNVTESGLYTFAARFLQNEKTDDISTRVLTIDGELPFAEAANITFEYASGWQTCLFGDGEQVYKFYLEEGQHTIRLTAALGESAEVIGGANSVLDRLNDIYIDIVMVTGTDPDTNRDYGIANLLPDVLEEMTEVSKELKSLEQQLNEIVGNDKGNATFRRLYEQLDLMVKNPEKVPKRLKNFRTNITALGTWINDSRSQPLMLDYLQLLTPEAEVPKAGNGLFSQIKHYVVQFIGSFIVDYAAVGNSDSTSEEKLTIWIGTGRDQADIIRKMLNGQFTPETGIEVELQLVNAGALLPATLAGNGPDVCLSVAETEPVNYALRDAVVDLSQLEGAEEVFSRFHEAALTPFELDGGVYALPETMEYPVLFYRKDILSELNIQEEDLQTWDTLLQNVLPELMLSYFDFGFSTDMKNYATLLYQYGGTFYNETQTAPLLDSSEAYSAFRTMTRLYTDYKIPKTYDFVNRFRSGQMPLAVASYTAYNQLSVFAPEIEGKWGMTTLPGVVDENGEIRNTAAVNVSGAIIMKDTDNLDAAWTFMKWWTQADVQSQYASELETILGTAARYPVANLEAAGSIQWSYDIKKALNAQQEDLGGVPQIAGSYYTNRYFDFAFRDVVENAENDRESLLDANENITNEIADKRKEIYEEEE